MKMLFTCTLLLLSILSFAQHKETAVSVSCYVNPELYLKGGIITFVSNKAGNYSCKGSFVTIYNGGVSSFFYRLNANTKVWSEVKPYKQVVIPARSARSNSGLSVVRLYAKYKEDVSGNLSVKIKTIAKMNAESDKVKARELRGIGETQGEEVAVVPKRSPPKPRASAVEPQAVDKTNKVPERSQTKSTVVKERAPAETAKKAMEVPLLDSTQLFCYNASDTAYYSFYYMKIRDTVLFSLPFPVERYEDESYGQRVLYNAWGCLSERITEQFGEARFNSYLNDVDYDLMTGFQHIRNPHIPSDTIVNDYPYTKSFASAEKEMRTWMKNEKALNQEVRFVEIDFPYRRKQLNNSN